MGKSPREPFGKEPRGSEEGAVRRGMGKMMVMILELRTTRKPVPVDVQCTMDDIVQQNQTHSDNFQCTWTKTMLMCYGMHL